MNGIALVESCCLIYFIFSQHITFLAPEDLKLLKMVPTGGERQDFNDIMQYINHNVMCVLSVLAKADIIISSFGGSPYTLK